jgi:hypothetical protein
MKSIGGFFELELPKGRSIYHDTAVKLSTGRACLNYIVKVLKPSKVFLPYYCCNALYEPLEINQIQYEFYKIDYNFEIIDLPQIIDGEFIIYCDFFGLKQGYIDELLNIYSDKLILDNTHSFFHKGYNSGNFSFTSARKYFGVPDGAFMYGPKHEAPINLIARNKKVSLNHNLHRLLELQELAFSEYLEYEKSLGSKIELISKVSECLLSNIDFKKVRSIRAENFNFFRDQFDKINLLNIEDNVEEGFCYPLLLKPHIDKTKLYAKNVYIPNLWIETTKRANNEDYPIECILSSKMLPLPIDHRYNLNDLERVSRLIKELQ